MIETNTRFSNAMTIAGFLAAIWVIGAVWQPTSTYHLAPLLVAGSVPGVAGSARKGRIAINAAVGVLLAVSVALLLAALGQMRGPSLLPYGGALAEAVTFAAAGAIAGLVLAMMSEPINGRTAAG